VDTPLLDLATGQPTALPAAKVGDAIASGSFAPTAGTEIPVLKGDGTIELVAAEHLDAARDQGWEIATEAQVQRFRDAQRYESGAAQVRTAGEAAARGLTLGLSDAAMVELGVDAEGLRKRKELNPLIAGAGEVAGAVAPLLLTGGGSGAASIAGSAVRTAGVLPRAVAGAGRAVEAGLRGALGSGVLARGAALGAAGAVEGGIYGLGQAVSEAALQDTPLTGERIAAHMGTGALLGGAVGGVLGSTTASLEKHVIPKIKELVNVQKLERMVETAGLKQWAQGRGKAMFTKLRRDFGDDAPIVIGRAVRGEGLDDAIKNGATWDEMHALTRSKVQASGARIGEALKQIDQAMPGEAAAAAQRIADRARREVAGALRTTGIRSDDALADRVLADFPGLFGDDAARAAAPRRAAPRAVGSDGGVMGAVDNVEVDALGTPLAPRVGDAFEEAAEQATSRGSAIRGGADIDPLTLAPRQATETTFESLHRLRARIDDIAFPKGLGDATPQQKALQKLRGIIEEEVTTAADAAFAKLPAQSPLAGAYSAEKQRYKALLWLDKAAESNAASEMANRTISLSDYTTGSAFTAGSLASLMGGDMSVLGSIAVSAFMGTGAAVVNKFLREQGQGIAAEIGHKVLRIAQTAQKQEREVTQAVGKFFKSAGDATRATVVSAGTDSTPLFTRFTEARSKLEQYEQQPEQKLSRSLGDTDLTAPVVANEVRATATRAAAFLRSKLPQDRISPYDAQPLLKRDGARVSDSQMAKYLRYQRAVERPREVIADLAEGKVSREGIEALKAVYPKLYADMSEKLTAKLAEQTERLPRAQLIQLSIALGQPLHPSLSPAFIAACQSVHAASRQAQQQGGPSGTPLNSTQPAKHMATESQRLEAGG
jgi:hypothetical protein